MVFQDFVRYKLSAADNIAFGRPHEDVDPSVVARAAKSSGAADVIDELPLGSPFFMVARPPVTPTRAPVADQGVGPRHSASRQLDKKGSGGFIRTRETLFGIREPELNNRKRTMARDPRRDGRRPVTERRRYSLYGP